ncbi:MAG: hypothetical protein WD512_08055 [Candidatus Paceibacterota bacterium]
MFAAIIKIIFQSNTTYGAAANAWFTGAISSAPEMMLFHLVLGLFSVYNEIKAKLNLNFSKFTSQKDSNFKRLHQSPALYRLMTSVVFIGSTILATFRGNYVDSIIFLGSALGSIAAAFITNKESGYQLLKESSLLAKLTKKILPYLSKQTKNFLADPGPSWLVVNLLLGIRNLSSDTLLQNIIVKTGLATASIITIVGLTLTLAQTILGKNIPKNIVIYLAAAQTASFAIVNLLVAEYHMAGCLTLWAISSFCIGRSMLDRKIAPSTLSQSDSN